MICDGATVLAMREVVERVEISEPVGRYLVDVVRATRSLAGVEVGASPRGALALLLSTRARAALAGRDFVLPDDVKALAVACLAHRLTLLPDLWLRAAGRKSSWASASTRCRFRSPTTRDRIGSGAGRGYCQAHRLRGAGRDRPSGRCRARRGGDRGSGCALRALPWRSACSCRFPLCRRSASRSTSTWSSKEVGPRSHWSFSTRAAAPLRSHPQHPGRPEAGRSQSLVARDRRRRHGSSRGPRRR